MSTDNASSIGLALSGGGVRAAAFHAGIFRWLAEKRLLGRVRHVSSVSGGSLFTGLVFHHSGYRWPGDEAYLDSVLPAIEETLTTRSLQHRSLVNLVFNPLNWRFLLSRANVVASTIESSWGIEKTLADLPLDPAWSINGTTAETGRRFRFKNREIGDFELGYADAGHIKLAEAMAVSAAFPVGIGPFKIDAHHFKWERKTSWDSSNPPREVELGFKSVSVYDGGVYDNLGMEPLFDVGRQTLKDEEGSPMIDRLIVSDAGAPYEREPIPRPLDPRRMQRIIGIVMDQTRALRVRCFVNYLLGHPGAGMYLQIGADPREKIERYLEPGEARDRALSSGWLPRPDVKRAATYATTLTKMTKADFALLSRHGFETAKWNELLFAS